MASILHTLNANIATAWGTSAQALTDMGESWKEMCPNDVPTSASHEEKMVIAGANKGYDLVVRCLMRFGFSPNLLVTKWGALPLWIDEAARLFWLRDRMARKDPEQWNSLKEDLEKRIAELCDEDGVLIDTSTSPPGYLQPDSLDQLEHLQPEVMVDDGPLGWRANGMVFAADPNDQFTTQAEKPRRGSSSDEDD